MMGKGLLDSKDEYGLKYVFEHAYHAEAKVYPPLYGRVMSRDWFEAQCAYDSSRWTYASNLEWALRAAEEDASGLSALLDLAMT